MGKKQEETEWLSQPEITKRTGYQSSWVHAKGAQNVVRRRQSGKFKGRPIYEYAYMDIIREADIEKVQAHQAAAIAVAKDSVPEVMPPMPPSPKTTVVNAAITGPPQTGLERLAAWLREGVSCNYITTESARALLATKAKL